MNTTNTFFQNLFKNQLNSLNNGFEKAQNNDLLLGGDEADIANLSREMELECKLLGRKAFYQKKVLEALDRIKNGDFGLCEECGNEISMNRLMARPTATLCVHCKEENEREETHIPYAKKSHTHGITLNNFQAI